MFGLFCKETNVYNKQAKIKINCLYNKVVEITRASDSRWSNGEGEYLKPRALRHIRLW